MKNLKKLVERSYELNNGDLKLTLYLNDDSKGLKEHKYNLVVETTKHNNREDILSKIVDMLESYFENSEKAFISVPELSKVVGHPDGVNFDIFYNPGNMDSYLMDIEGEFINSYTKGHYNETLNRISRIRGVSANCDKKALNEEYLQSYRRWKEARMIYFRDNQNKGGQDRYSTISSLYKDDDVLMTCEFEFGYDEDDDAESDGYCKGYYKTKITFPEYFIAKEEQETKSIWEFENGELYNLLLEELGWIGYSIGEVESSVLKKFDK